MDPLEAALASSFTAPNVPPSPSGAPGSSTQETKPKEQQRRHLVQRSVELEAERQAAMDESWKEEYDERLNTWKAENAARREHSEKTRKEYESRRSTVDFSTTSTGTRGNITGASSVGGSFVDARDLVAGEHEGGNGKEALDHVLSPAALLTGQPTHTQQTSGHGSGEDTSQGWENVPSGSLASSYPSINFPPTVATRNASHPSHGQDATTTTDPTQRRTTAAGLAFPPIAPPSVTLSIFDSTLSTRARLLALASSLAINLFLPFVNGVMLGFGEIAAKSLFGWSGWGNVASQLGLRGGHWGRGNADVQNRRRIANRGKDTPTLLTMP